MFAKTKTPSPDSALPLGHDDPDSDTYVPLELRDAYLAAPTPDPFELHNTINALARREATVSFTRAYGLDRYGSRVPSDAHEQVEQDAANIRETRYAQLVAKATHALALRHAKDALEEAKRRQAAEAERRRMFTCPQCKRVDTSTRMGRTLASGVRVNACASCAAIANALFAQDALNGASPELVERLLSVNAS